MSAYEVNDLGRHERRYRSVLSGMRVCQLYCFMLLFIVLIKVFFFAAQYGLFAVTWLISRFYGLAAIDPPALEALALSWEWTEILFLANVWIIYAIYSGFRPWYPVVLLCIVALGHSIQVQLGWLFADNDQVQLSQNGLSLEHEMMLYRYGYAAGLIVSHGYFLYIAVRAQVSIHSLEAGARATLSEFPRDAHLLRESIRELINIPRAVIYSSRKFTTGFLMVVSGVANFLNYWRLSIGYAIACFTPVFYGLSLPFASAAETAIVTNGDIWRGLSILGVALLFVGLLVALLWGSLVFVRMVCRFAIRAARNQMRISLQDIQHHDNRPPILFLRSFLDDKVTLGNKFFSLEQWLLDAGSRTMTLDDLMLREGTAFGPTVALGNPDDPAPPYGVARGYFSHDTWKEAVGQLCEDSQFIIMVLDTTEGVDWEIGHIVRRRYTAKTLFLLAPEDIGSKKGAQLLVKALSRLDKDWTAGHHVQLDREQNVFGFRFDQSGGIRLLKSDRISTYNYLVAIRSFMRNPGWGQMDAKPTHREA